jgi:hypothetical protein
VEDFEYQIDEYNKSQTCLYIYGSYMSLLMMECFIKWVSYFYSFLTASVMYKLYYTDKIGSVTKDQCSEICEAICCYKIIMSEIYACES